MPKYKVTYNSGGQEKSDTIEASQDLIDLRLKEGKFTSASLEQTNQESNQNSSGNQSSTNSSGVVNSTDDLRVSLQDELNNLVSETESYRDQLAKQREESLKAIEAQAQQEQATEESRFKNQVGRSTLALAGAQAFRTQSALGHINKLEQSHLDQLQVISDRKQRLINEANTAYSDKDFQAVQYKLEQARALRQDEVDLMTKIETLKINRLKEDRAQAEFELSLRDAQRSEQKDIASSLAAGLVMDSQTVPNEDEINQMSLEYGIDPVFLVQAINDRTDAVRKLETENFKMYFDIANKLKKDEEIVAPDGTVIKGLDDSKDVLTYEATIGSVKYKVGADKNTGEILWKNEIGRGGGTSGKTITWAQAKELGDLSLYGKPVAEMYKAPEALTFTDWLYQQNLNDPANWPLQSSPEAQSAYVDYVNSLESPAEKLENTLGDEGSKEEQLAYGLEIARANKDASETDDEIAQFILENTEGLTLNEALKIVNQVR